MPYGIQTQNCKYYLRDESDGDEVYIKSDGKKVWPVDAKYLLIGEENTLVGLEIILRKGGSLEIEICDYDLLSADDHLGSLTLYAEAHGTYVKDFTKLGKDQSKYELEGEIG